MPDELPDLQNDEDVDALMSRLSARLPPPRRGTATPVAVGASTGDPLEALLAADAQCHTATHRVIELIVEWMAESGPMATVVAMQGRPRPTRRAAPKRPLSKAVRAATKRRRES
jgi:hypothetical protein